MRRLPLLLALSALSLPAATAVWIDTDPSVARGGHEIDDGFALVQAFHSAALEVRGVSVVFGNAPLPEGILIGERLVREFGPPGMPVYRGAASAKELGIETAASRALAAALRREELLILALGPATNIATLVRTHPELSHRIKKIVAVAGRRPGQRFSTAPNVRPFRDFNFELDAPAFQLLLDSKIPLVLAPWEISSKVWLRQADLTGLRSANSKLDWILDASEDWLAFWKKNLAVDGLNPFDTLAVGYVISPDGFQCGRLPVQIQTLPDDTALAQPSTKPYLILDNKIDSRHTALYCSEAPAHFSNMLIRLLIQHD